MRRRTSTVMPLYSFPLLVSTMYTCHGFEAAEANANAARTPAMAARATVCTLWELVQVVG